MTILSNIQLKIHIFINLPVFLFQHWEGMTHHWNAKNQKEKFQVRNMYNTKIKKKHENNAQFFYDKNK